MSEQQTRIFLGERKEEEDIDAEEVLARTNEAKKDRWLAIFIQLNNSRRFRTFLENNFVIADKIDDEQQVETVVIENPIAVGPALTLDQVTAVFSTLKLANCPRPKETCDKIFACLGQEDNAISKLIVSPDEAAKL